MSGRPTPETDDLARGNHVVPTEWAEQLERERDEARAERDETRFLLNAALSALDAINLQLGNFKKIVKENTD
jgi:phytoene dehydrogenase-like protein